MQHRLARFDIEAWTRHCVLAPSKNNFKKLTKNEVARKDCISRMYDKVGREHVERFIISGDSIYISMDSSKNGCRIFSIDDDCCYQPLCKFDEWSDKKDLVEDFEKKYKRALAIEKLSKESAPVIGDKDFEDAQSLRVTVSKGDITYELPTHCDYYSIDRTAYYVDIVDGKLVPKEIEYGQSLYFNNISFTGSYLNIPKERMYIIVNDIKDYHEEGQEGNAGIFLDGKSITDEALNVKDTSLEEIIKKYDKELRDNVLKQTITPDKFVDFNDHKVEFYVEHMDR